jgi:N-acetyl-alpha-D-muramate 1-phosphate uridylyltransferase
MSATINIPCMILAAGRGERMRPLTDHTPKPLLKVQGKALMDWHIDGLAQNGANRIVINHAWLGEKIVEHSQQINPTLDIYLSAEESALETAGGLRQALPLLDPQDYFFVINGDVFCPDFPFSKIQEIVKTIQSQKNEVLAYLFLVPNPEHHPEGDFCLSGTWLREDNPKLPKFTFSGAGIYHRKLINHLALGEVAKLAPLLREAIAKDQVMGELLEVNWIDVGTPERLAELNKEKL